MEPVSILTLLVYVPLFLALLFVFGNPVRVFFVRYKRSELGFDFIEKVVLSLAFGAALIPLVIMMLTLGGHILNVSTATVLTVLLAAVNLYLYRHRLVRLRPKGVRLSRRTLIIVAVIISIFIFHFYPTLGLYVYPGDDGKGYALISIRIIESGGYTETWGNYIAPSWYQEIVHLIVAGFAGICAYFTLLTGLPIETSILLNTVTFMAMMSLSVYFLARRLFKDQRAALGSALIFGIFIREPSIAPFSWGGNAELSSLFLLPILLGLFWEVFHGRMDIRQKLLVGVLVAGSTLLHPFSTSYLLFALIPFLVYIMLSRREIRPLLDSLGILALAVIIISPIIVKAVIFELPIAQSYESYPNPFWTPMFSWSQTPEQVLYSAIWRFAAVYGIGSFFLLLISIDAFRRHKTEKEPIILLALWVLAIFFVHENNPNGLWLVRFPLWYRIDTNRVFSVTSFAVSIVIGKGLNRLMQGFPDLSSKMQAGFSSAIRNFPKVIRSRRTITVIVLIMLFGIQLYMNILQNSISHGNSSVTDSDIVAFQWIKQNISQDSMIFVLPYDGGQWIPIYTQGRVLIPFGVVTNITLQRQYYDKIYPAFAHDPDASLVIRFFSYHRVRYVYLGAKVVLPELYPLRADPEVLLKSPFYRPVYNHSNVFIFEYRNPLNT